MLHILAEVAPLKVADGSRPVLRASSAQDRRLNGVAGLRWWPAIAKLPSLAIPLFDGDFTDEVAPGSAAFTVRLNALELLDADVRSYRWPGAAVSLYAIDPATALNAAGSYDIAELAAKRIFKGRVEAFAVDGGALALTAEVDQEPFNKDVLRFTYAGTGDAEGGEDLKDRLKPWIFGRALNVEPILINSVDNVVQFSAYAIQGISALYERGSSLGPSIGNYATYDQLVAATIPAGRWATCHALGMARLGAPPYGVITGDVDGDNAGGFIRKTGAIIRRVALDAGVPVDLIDTASLNALDAAVPYNINLMLTEQLTVLELARRLALPCNAQAGINFLGQLFTVRPTIGAPTLTLDAQGRRMPAVRRCQEADVSAPYKRIMFGANRSWRVHTFDEVAFDSPLLDRGDYDPEKVYRRGNIVSLPNGSRWLYVSDTPKKGSYPSESNADWELMTGAITAGNINYEDGTPVEALKPAEPGATAGAPPGTVVGELSADDVIDALKEIALASEPGEILSGVKAMADAFKELTQSVSATELVGNAKALVDRLRNSDMAALEQLVLSQERAERFNNLTHMDGKTLGSRVLTETIERVSADEALALRVDEVEAFMTDATSDLSAQIIAETAARVTADAAETAQRVLAISNLTTLVDDEISEVTAAIASEATTRASADAAETATRTAQIATLTTGLSNANSAITNEATARAAADLAETNARTAAVSTLTTGLSNANSAISAEASTRAAADLAETSARNIAISNLQTTLNGQISDVSAAVASEATTRAAADLAETTTRSGQIATLTTNLNGEVTARQAAITAEASARATAIGAETTSRNAAISSLRTELNGNISAAILSEANTRATADTAEVNARIAAVAALDSDIADVSAMVADETTARVTADSALASSISGVSTTVDGHTASITMLSASVDGVAAKWGLNLNSNGHIIGILANNDGDMGGFDIVADWLRIWDASGLHNQAVFDYSGGILKMPNIQVDTIAAGSGNSAQFGGKRLSNSVPGAGMGSAIVVLSKEVELLQPGAIQANGQLAVAYSGSVTASNFALYVAGSNVFSTGGGTTEISVGLAGYKVLPAGKYTVDIVVEGPSNMTVVDRNLSTIIIYAGKVRYNLAGSTLAADMSFSRASTANVYDAAGALQSAAVNVPRFDYDRVSAALLGLAVEPSALNEINNNAMAGAVVGDLAGAGRLPDGWTMPSGTGGVTAEITAIGSENGHNFIDLQFSGTASSTSVLTLNPDNAGAAAVAGEIWTNSVFLSLRSGSLANVSSFLLRAGSEGGSTSLNSLNFTLTRYINTRTLTAASARQVIRFNWAAVGAAINFKMRIALPQREIGSRATSVIKTGKNLIAKSEDLNNAFWNKPSATITNSAGLDPFGGMRLNLVNENAASNTIINASALSVVSGATYTYSFYAKRGNHDWVRIVIGDNSSGTNSVRLWINLATGALGSNSATGTGWAVVGTPAIQSVANGLYRISISFSVGASGLYIFWLSAAGNNTTTRADAGSGTGINTQHYWFGGQLEAGAAMTAYQSSVRAGDVLTLSWEGRNIPDGAYMVRYTFDDGSYQDVPTAVAGGTSTVPTNLNRAYIKRIDLL